MLKCVFRPLIKAQVYKNYLIEGHRPSVPSVSEKHMQDSLLKQADLTQCVFIWNISDSPLTRVTCVLFAKRNHVACMCL